MKVQLGISPQPRVFRGGCNEHELLLPVDSVPEAPVEPQETLRGTALYGLFGVGLTAGLGLGVATALYGGVVGGCLGAGLGLAFAPLTSAVIDHARGYGTIVTPFWPEALVTSSIGAAVGAVTASGPPAILTGFFGLLAGVSALIPLCMAVGDRDDERRQQFEEKQSEYLEQLARSELQAQKRRSALGIEDLDVVLESEEIKVGDFWIARES